MNNGNRQFQTRESVVGIEIDILTTELYKTFFFKLPSWYVVSLLKV